MSKVPKHSIILMSITKIKTMKRTRNSTSDMFAGLESMQYLDAPKKQKRSARFAAVQKASYLAFSLVMMTLLTIGSSFTPNTASADSINDQINALQAENANNANAVADLQNQATSYLDAIERLQAQIANLQGQINNR